MHKGYLSLLLHTHLPFVRHPEEDYFLEENWLYEAITETYIPLIQAFDRLIDDGVDFRVTMSLTPPLVSMLKDPLLQDRYIRHIEKLIELSEKEIDRTGYMPHYHGLALMYNRKFSEARDTFVNKYKKDIVNAFKGFQEHGNLEIITSCATHGFLPILSVNSRDAEAQVNIGVDYYKKIFGRQPKGIWLPECGYYHGAENILKDAGIRFFFVDSHGIINADPSPRYSVYAPIYCPNGVAAFGRDWESSKQVWSAREGYPGDPDYREYYRDIGHELEFDYIKPYIHPQGIRVNTGIKYWRITGKTEYKEAYVPDWAREKAALHAANFMFNREKQIEHLTHHMDRKPIILSPYDAELFGHWWFEGPMWIELLMRKVAYDQKTFRMITPSEYLKEYSKNQVALPSPSSWGWKGYYEFWLEGGNDWIYKHMHKAGVRMREMAEKYSVLLANPSRDKLKVRAMDQAARELVLAQSSDWAFIMKTGTMVPYAHKRVKTHIGRFNRIYDDVKNNSIDREWLSEVERRDNIFSDMNCAAYYLPRQLKDSVLKAPLHKNISARKPAKKTRTKTIRKHRKKEMAYAK